MTAGNGLTDIDKLGADDAWFVEWNVEVMALALQEVTLRVTGKDPIPLKDGQSDRQCQGRSAPDRFVR